MRTVFSTGSLVPEPASESMHRPAVPAESDRPSEATEPGSQKSTVHSESAHHPRQGTAIAIKHRVPGFGHLRVYPFDHPLSAELFTESAQSLFAAESADFADLVRSAIRRFAGPSHPHVTADSQLQPERHQFVQFRHASRQWRPLVLYESTCPLGRQ